MISNPTGMPHPLTLAVIRHKLQAVAEEMVETMTHTCFSPILNQNQDFSAVVLDAAGRTLAQAERVPVHMGAMPYALRAMAEAFAGDIGEGDVLMANDPYWGGSHLPDITLARPVFDGGELILWVALRAHQGDIGGISAGGYSAGAREIWHEGIRIPPVKLCTAGVLRHDLLRMIAANSRRPDDLRGDLMAQLASVAVGAERLGGLFDRYGAAEVARCGDSILDGGEKVMRNQISRWKEGEHTGLSWLEPEHDGPLIPVRARVTLRDGHAVVDLTDNPDQMANFLNSPIANTIACVNVAFMYLSENAQVLNEGSARAIEVITRKGSLLDPELPAPVVACTSLTAAAVIEAVLGALEQAAPAQAIAGFTRRFRFALAGTDRAGQPYIWHYFFNRGGAGANADADGWTNLGGIHNPGGSPSPSIERTEAGYPMLVEAYALRPNSGGTGERRGGLGGILRLRYEGNAPAILNAAGEGVRVAPRGILGGEDGAPHAYSLERANGTVRPIGPRDAGVVIAPGDTIVCLSAGGGGYGPAARRPAAAAQADATLGYVQA